MTIKFVGSPVEVVIYLLCVITSLLCAYLLARAYRRSHAKLLMWSSVCFGLLAVNNFLLAVDILLLPDIDLIPLRILTALAAVGVQLYAFIWETA